MDLSVMVFGIQVQEPLEQLYALILTSERRLFVEHVFLVRLGW